MTAAISCSAPRSKPRATAASRSWCARSKARRRQWVDGCCLVQGGPLCLRRGTKITKATKDTNKKQNNVGFLCVFRVLRELRVPPEAQRRMLTCYRRQEY